MIPEYGTLHRGGNVVVLDLGKLKVESELQPKNLSMKVRRIVKQIEHFHPSSQIASGSNVIYA